MNNYLKTFPEEHRQYVRSRFAQAYVFSEQAVAFGEDDEVELACGPIEMKRRVVQSCERLLPVVDAVKKSALVQIIATVDESEDLMMEVRREIEERWKRDREWREAHPPKERKKAEPPSEKQLKYLKSLGCVEVPKSKKEATKLIDKYKKR